MRCLYLIPLLGWLIATGSCSAADSERIYLCANARRSGVTNEWWLPLARLDSLPKWYPEKQPLPLSLEKALRTAKKWAAEQAGVPKIWLQSVTIRSVQPNEERYQHVFYFKFLFGVDPFDRIACVVLMDGTVLEPFAENVTYNKRAPKHK
jgi:hypothetical protein